MIYQNQNGLILRETCTLRGRRLSKTMVAMTTAQCIEERYIRFSAFRHLNEGGESTRETKVQKVSRPSKSCLEEKKKIPAVPSERLDHFNPSYPSCFPSFQPPRRPRFIKDIRLFYTFILPLVGLLLLFLLVLQMN